MGGMVIYLFVVLVVAWSVCLYLYRDKDLSVFVNTWLTGILVMVTIFYAIATQKYVELTRDMSNQMKISNQINLRPYVIISEVPGDELKSRLFRNEKLSSRSISKGYLLTDSRTDEGLLCSVQNLGSISATKVQYTQEVYLVDEISGAQTPIKVDEHSETISECILPKQTITRNIKLPKNTLYRPDTQNKHFIVTMKASYSGSPDIEQNRYYYKVKLKVYPSKNVEEMNNSEGKVFTVETDEGLEAISK
jgi:hypothetical protein